jgi:hypothetical protein
MMRNRIGQAALALLLLGAAGCADLDITHPYAADRQQALSRADDVETLIGGTFVQWFRSHSSVFSAGLWMSVASFQHSSSAANFAMLQYGAIPRIPIQNDPTDQEYEYISEPWYLNYRGLGAIAQGLGVLQSDTVMQNQMGAARLARIRAYAKFMQGLHHAHIAATYHQGYIVDETVSVFDAQGNYVNLGEPVGYQQVMQAALGYFDEALAMLEAGEVTLNFPALWLAGEAVSPTVLAGYIHGLKAMYMAGVARAPAERRDVSQGGLVDWQKVIELTSKATPWTVPDATARASLYSPSWASWVFYALTDDWQLMNYMMMGMADQSGNYQEWLSRPLAQRHPKLDSDRPFLIHTPDQRFPQGATLQEQHANPGLIWEVPDQWFGNGLVVENRWSQPGRGTWRWSYYFNPSSLMRYYGINWALGDRTPITYGRDLRLLAAEGYYRLGELAQAVAIVDETRIAWGGMESSGAGNLSCVPRLPSGACGDFFEMLKWEKRQHSWGAGIMHAAWYFDGRGWGDLYAGTPLDLPVPGVELATLGQAVYTRGGVGQPGGAPRSTYAFPFEP